MKAVVVEKWMDPSELAVSETDEPEVLQGMLGVDVHAAGCNFFDILMVQGTYQLKPPFPFTPGSEVAGVVREVGDGVEGFSPGDRVMASIPYGGYAERAAVPAMVARPIPDGMSFEEAAGFPIVYPTSHAALVYRGRVHPGETVLVTAGAGGVGLSSVQIAHALGARVIALAGGDEKLEVARKNGADVAIDYREGDWLAAVKKETGGRGADVIIENVGGEVFDNCTRCIAWDGRLVLVGFAGGKIPEVKLNRVLLKHITLVGLHWGMMIQHQPELVAASHRALAELYANGSIHPRVWKAFELGEAAAALQALSSRKTWGKVVLSVR